MNPCSACGAVCVLYQDGMCRRCFGTWFAEFLVAKEEARDFRADWKPPAAGSGAVVLVCGSRGWTDYELLLGTLRSEKPAAVVEGGCCGADRMARRAGFALGLLWGEGVREYPADWSLGRGAGPIRNATMLKAESPGLVLAFSDRFLKGTGTFDMAARARAVGVPVVLFYHGGSAS